MSACEYLAQDIDRVCGENGPKQGVEQKIVLFPIGNISAITRSNGLITALTLSAVGYSIDGVNEMIRYESSFVEPENGVPGYIHRAMNIPILDPSVEARNALNAIAAGGGKYVAVIERLAKGASDEDAFIVLGVECGLSVRSDGANENSNENDGMIILNLSSRENIRESRPPDCLLLTDYATTKTAFDAAFNPA